MTGKRELLVIHGDLPHDDEDVWEAVEDSKLPPWTDEAGRRIKCLLEMLFDSDAADAEPPRLATPDDHPDQSVLALTVVDHFAGDNFDVVVTTAQEFGLAVIDLDEGLIHRTDGFRGIILTKENTGPLFAPTAKQVQAVVDELTADGGPSFMCLARGNDYVQAAGGPLALVVETREWVGENFRHWRACRDTSRRRRKVSVLTNGFQVDAYTDEKMSKNEAFCIMIDFCNATPRAANFRWRDMTAEFNPPPRTDRRRRVVKRAN